MDTDLNGAPRNLFPSACYPAITYFVLLVPKCRRYARGNTSLLVMCKSQ